MNKKMTKAEIELEITRRVTEKAVKYEVSVQARYYLRFEEIHEDLNKIMDSSTMYDNDKLKMAESVIEFNRHHATEARRILRGMMK